MVEGARLESVCASNGTAGSNPVLSARIFMTKLFHNIGRLELIAFATGFCLMAYELVAARILAPSIGSSTYVWTSVIGVIIAALSFGYYAGGRVADERNRASDVVWLLCFATVAVVMTELIYTHVLDGIVELDVDPRWQAVMAAGVLFAPTSFVLGMISPYLVKLNVHSLEKSGRAVASLSTCNAMGSIVGTFVTGFVLFGWIGARETLLVVAIGLIAAGWLLVPSYRTAQRLGFSIVMIALLLLPTPTAGTVEIDTATAHYRIERGVIEGRGFTGLSTGPGGVQSGVWEDGSREPVFWYTAEMARLALELQPKRILMLGGGAFTVPQYLAEKLPGSQIDVVEIDPGLKKISEQYFDYENPSNVELIFDDARRFLNTSERTYDLILVDVYGDTSIPFSLMTREYTAALADRLAPGGAVIANIIGGTDGGPCSEALGALDAVYRAEFGAAQYSTQDNQVLLRGNHIIVYGQVGTELSGLRPLPKFEQIAYTDNYAPAERLYFACRQM